MGAAMVDHNRLLKHYPQVKYDSSDQLEVSWVMSSPNDFIAGKPDLPPSTSVRAKDPNASLGTTYWEYMCVLIAIIKSEGYGAVNTKDRAESEQPGPGCPSYERLLHGQKRAI